MSDNKKKRCSYDARFKLQVVAYATEHNNNYRTAKKFKICEKQVRDWKKAAYILSTLNKNKKALRGLSTPYAADETLLRDWVLSLRQMGYDVTRKEMRMQAQKSFSDPNFKASPGWCNNFISRNALSHRAHGKPHEVPGAEDNSAAITVDDVTISNIKNETEMPDNGVNASVNDISCNISDNISNSRAFDLSNNADYNVRNSEMEGHGVKEENFYDDFHEIIEVNISSATSSSAARENLKNIEKSKIEQIQKLTDELGTLECNHSALKSKQEGLKARNQVMNNEVRSLREQLKVLIEKAKNDEELVEALLKQQTQLRNALIESGKAHERLSSIKNTNTSASRDEQSVQRLNEEMVTKEAKIIELEGKLLEVIQSHHHNDVSAYDSLEGHPSNANNHSRNNSTDRSGEVRRWRTLNLTLTFELDKLKEMLSHLGASNDELTKRMAEKECELKACLKKCGRLEGEVRRLYSGSGAERRQKNDSNSKTDLEALQLKLETLEDEKRALKSALEASFKAKKEQLALCEQILQQTRSAYAENALSGGGDDAGGGEKNNGVDGSSAMEIGGARKDGGSGVVKDGGSGVVKGGGGGVVKGGENVDENSPCDNNFNIDSFNINVKNSGNKNVKFNE